MSVELPGIGGSDPESTRMVLVKFEVYEINLCENEARDASNVLTANRRHNRLVSDISIGIITFSITSLLTFGVTGPPTLAQFGMDMLGTVLDSEWNNNDEIWFKQGVYFWIVAIYINERDAYFSLSSLISKPGLTNGAYDMAFRSIDPQFENVNDFNNIVGYN